MHMKVTAEPGAGLPAFSYYMPYHPKFWSQIKPLIASGVPILVRLYPGTDYPMPAHDLHRTVDREGHVVMISGYDDTTAEVIVEDPWDASWGGERGGRTRIPYAVFASTCVDNTFDYMDVLVPWEMELSIDDESAARRVTARIHYTCPEPLDPRRHDVRPLRVEVELPPGLALARDASATAVVEDGIRPRQTVEVSWSVEHTGAVDGDVTVRARGVVHGTRPYEYEDEIGSRGVCRVALPAPARHAAAETL